MVGRVLLVQQSAWRWWGRLRRFEEKKGVLAGSSKEGRRGVMWSVRDKEQGRWRWKAGVGRRRKSG